MVEPLLANMAELSKHLTRVQFFLCIFRHFSETEQKSPKDITSLNEKSLLLSEKQISYICITPITQEVY